MAGINLAETGQKLDRLLYNMAEQNRKFYDLYFNPNPQNISLPQLDENGNLVTVTIPNRAMVKQQIWADAQSAMSKVFYVDATNGSDDNNGSENAPFKTLKKAIDSVPSGGDGTIILLSDYGMSMTSEDIDTYHPISVKNKSILLQLNTHTLNIISTDDGVNSFLPAFGVSNRGDLFLLNGTINMPTQSNGLPWQFASGFIKGGDGGGYPAFVKMFGLTINIPANSAPFLLTGIGAWDMSTNYVMRDITITTDTLPFLKIQNSQGYCCLGTSAVTATDSLGNALAWNDLISGIVRDSNGIPRNIVSNYVL